MFTDSAFARQPGRAGFVSNRRSAKRYATEQFVPLLSRRSRISAGFVLPIKCARFLGGAMTMMCATRAGPCAAALKKGDVMTLISSGKAAAGLRRILLSLAVVAAVVSLGAGAAQAQASRTWVSGVGDDANPCGIM